MTPNELERLKKLLEKADKAVTKKHEQYFYENNILDTQSSYSLFLSIMRLKIKLDLGINDEYLLDKPRQKK